MPTRRQFMRHAIVSSMMAVGSPLAPACARPLATHFRGRIAQQRSRRTVSILQGSVRQHVGRRCGVRSRSRRTWSGHASRRHRSRQPVDARDRPAVEGPPGCHRRVDERTASLLSRVAGPRLRDGTRVPRTTRDRRERSLRSHHHWTASSVLLDESADGDRTRLGPTRRRPGDGLSRQLASFSRPRPR